MSKLYNIKGKTALKNEHTGEILTAVSEVTLAEKRLYPIRGYQGVYMKTLANIVELSKPAQKLLFKLMESKHRTEYNILIVKWKDIGSELGYNQQYTSKIKKELEDKEFILKYRRRYMLNPYVVLPLQCKVDDINQWKTQMIWKKLAEDKDNWYDGIYEDMREIF